MADFEVVYIQPKEALGALTVQPKVAQHDPDLGPSGPHQIDEEFEEADEQLGVPGLSLSPGSPPLVAAAHYTNLLDEIWPEFDDPEERTAARLSSLLEEVADEALRVHLLAQDVWEKLPNYKVTPSERERYDKEFLAYERRLLDYQRILADLDPDSTATDEVYVGLVKRRQGAGPVADCIMHMYFAQQLGILADHADDMGEGFVGRVMETLEVTNEAIDEAGAAIDEKAEEASKQAESLWTKITRPIWIGTGAVVGSIFVVGASILVLSASEDDR